MLADPKPSGNEDFMFGQSEIIISEVDGSKKVVPKSMLYMKTWGVTAA